MLDKIRKYIEKYGGKNKDTLLQFHDSNVKYMHEASASTYSHHWWIGGYYDHVLECLVLAEKMYNLFSYREFPFDFSSVLLVLYVHDLDKIGALEEDKEIESVFNDKIKFTAEEYNALDYIDGEGKELSTSERIVGRLGAFCGAVHLLSTRLWYDFPNKYSSDKSFNESLPGN